jgi:hypothetical protein
MKKGEVLKEALKVAWEVKNGVLIQSVNNLINYGKDYPIRFNYPGHTVKDYRYKSGNKYLTIKYLGPNNYSLSTNLYD